MSAYNLDKINTQAPKNLDKERIKSKLAKLIEELSVLQNLFYAEGKHSLLIVLQGLDASGKDGTIKNVFGSLNPQGVSVSSFKVPTEEELKYDFLWRIHKNTPEKGMIKIFNRSHYEDVLVTRVHGWCDDVLAKKRMKAINQFEDLLIYHNNTIILKFYLHVSKDEQVERLAERMKDPAKMWKYNANDMNEAQSRAQYYQYYQECFEKCNKPEWHIIPSDQNWYKEYTIAKIIRDVLVSLKMKYPNLKN